jgi:hypothetical protein
MPALCLFSQNEGMIEFRYAPLMNRLCPAMLCKSLIAAFAVVSALGWHAYAQAPAPAQPQVVMPDRDKIVLLLRTTLNSLNDAIQTGNFTVLRDMAAPDFRENNNAAQLSQSFSDLAANHIDLSTVSIIEPQLSDDPALDQQKKTLHLKGYFPGNVVQIDFDLLYQAVDGHWRLSELSVKPGPPTTAAGDASAPASGTATMN